MIARQKAIADALDALMPFVTMWCNIQDMNPPDDCKINGISFTAGKIRKASLAYQALNKVYDPQEKSKVKK